MKATSQSADRPNSPRRLSRRRRWAFRIAAAIGAPVLFLLLLEGGLCLFGYGHPTSFTLTEEVNDRPCYVPNPAFGWRFFPRKIAREALWFAYPVEKPSNTIRIFVLGGSAAQGDPESAYGVERFLSRMLRRRYPDTDFEVVNVAMTAINSHVVRDIAAEVIHHHPDLLILYLGNNEVVGPFGAGNPLVPFSERMTTIRASLFVKETGTGQLAEQTIRAVSPSSAEPEKWRGMEMFLETQVSLGDERMQNVYSNFQTNLECILTDAESAGVPVVMSTVGVNLRDCAPFSSLHDSHLDAGGLAKWTQLYEDGIAQQKEGEFEAAVTAFLSANGLDDQYAELHYRLGHCYLALGKPTEAKRCFERARDLDTLRFRADSTINDTIREVAAEAGDGVSLVDAAQMYEDASPSEGIPGDAVFFEHVHMTFHGNYLLARSLLGKAEERLQDRLGAPQGPVPSEEECAMRLALTDFDRQRVLELIVARLENPPFTGQIDNEARLAAKRLEVRRLEQARTKESVDAGKALYKKAVAESPNDGWLHLRHGFFLLNAAEEPVDAEDAFRSAIGTGLREAELYLGLGTACYQQQRPTDAIAAFREGLLIEPRQWRMLSQLGFALNLNGDSEAALASCTRAVELAPNNPDVHTNLGLVLLDQRDFPGAMDYFEDAIDLGGETAPRLVNLGLAQGALGNRQKGVTCFAKAVELEPADFRANREMGQVRLEARDFAAALGHFERAHLARPDDVPCANNLAWLLATCPESSLRNGPRAVQLALNVCQTFGDSNPALLDTLAAAYAEAGQFELAVSAVTEALARSTDRSTAQQLQARLHLYRDGLPFREAP